MKLCKWNLSASSKSSKTFSNGRRKGNRMNPDALCILAIIAVTILLILMTE